MDKLDTNIDNWSMNDILDLFGLSNPSLSDILATSNAFMEASTDPTIKKFIQQAQDKSTRILSSYDYDSYQEQTSDTLLDWNKHQYLKQKIPYKRIKSLHETIRYKRLTTEHILP